MSYSFCLAYCFEAERHSLKMPPAWAHRCWAFLKTVLQRGSQVCGTEKDKQFIHKNLTFRCCCKKCFLRLPSNAASNIYRKCQFYVFLIFVILLIGNILDTFRQMENNFHDLQTKKDKLIAILRINNNQQKGTKQRSHKKNANNRYRISCSKASKIRIWIFLKMAFTLDCIFKWIQIKVVGK